MTSWSSSRVGLAYEHHGVLGEVMPVGGIPLVVLLDQDVASEPEQGSWFGSTPTSSVRRLISLLRRSNGFVDQICCQ